MIKNVKKQRRKRERYGENPERDGGVQQTVGDGLDQPGQPDENGQS